MIATIDLGCIEVDLHEMNAALLDRRIDESLREVRRSAFTAALAVMEESLLQDRTCPACGAARTVKSREECVVGMLAGAVTVPVRRLSCPGCGSSAVPLADILPHGKHTLAVAEISLLMATELSYAKSSLFLKRLCGIEISHGQIQRLATAEAAHVGVRLIEASEQLREVGLCPEEHRKRDREDTLVIAVDGGHVPDRASGDDFEAKVGVVFGAKAEVSKGRMKLLDRVAYAGIDPAQTFSDRLTTLAVQQGMLTAGRTILIGDGAGWIRTMARDAFPSAVYVLDLYHLGHRVREVLREDPETLERVMAACLAGDPAQAVRILVEWMPPTPDRHELRRRLVVYIRTNATGIVNYTRTDLFGSGCVEKAVDIMVSRRFKLRGMSWLRPGAQGMLKLKLLRFNEEWDTHWEGRLTAA